MVIAHKNGMVARSAGKWSDPADGGYGLRALYGLAVSQPKRPWSIVDWDSGTMYLPEESLYVNGQAVRITADGSARGFGDNSLVSIPQLAASSAVFCFIVPRELSGAGDEGGCYKAYIAEAASVEDDVSFRFPVVVDGRPMLSGSVIIDGLKGYHKIAPLQLDWLDVTDSVSGVTQRKYRIFTPSSGSVVYNDTWLPIEESCGEDWLYVQPNKNYYCHVNLFEAHIDDNPSREGEFKSFIIGGFFT